MSHVGAPLESFIEQSAPGTIAISDHGKALHLAYADSEHWIPFSRLRTACRCAHCTRARIDGKFPAAFEGVAIQTLADII